MKETKKSAVHPKDLLKKRPAAVIRLALQIMFFVLAPGLFTSAFGGVKNIASAMGKGQALTLSAHVTTLILLLGFTLLFGRIFCGSACAFGFLGDVVHFAATPLRKKLLGKKQTITPPRKLYLLKYAVLIFILAICAGGGQSAIRGNSPWDAFAQLISGHINFDGYVVGYILLVLVVIGMAAVPRFFCRFLCPMGALFSLLPPPLLVRLKKPTTADEKHRACGSCTLCRKNCPAGLTLNTADAITSGECFSCFGCVDTCYQQKPHLTIFGRRVNTHVVYIVLGLLLAVLAAIFTL